MTCVNPEIFLLIVYYGNLERQVCILNGKSGKVDNWLIICMTTLSFPPEES